MRSSTSGLLGAAALFVTSVSSQAAVHIPQSANAIKYSVSVPASTQSTGSGDIFMQLSAPTSYQWIGLGMGKQMAGAHVLVMYQDGKGNVTISPRNAVGEIMPLYNPQADVTLLEGSGVTNGQMVANVRYTVNNTILDATSTTSPWICSWKTGSSLDSTNPAAVIQQHDAHDQFTYNLQSAKAQADSNPFVAASTTSSGDVGSTSGSSSGGTDDDDGGSNTKFQEAHGILMSIALVLILPCGAIAMRLGINIWIHAFIQIFALCLIVAGFGLGTHLAMKKDILFKNPHTIIGLVVFIAIMLQPFIGILHHRLLQKRGIWIFGLLHVWWGRMIILLGMINGGLGLMLANNSKKGEIAYGVVAGVVGVIWILVVVVTMFRPSRKGSNDTEGQRLEKRSPPSSEN